MSRTADTLPRSHPPIWSQRFIRDNAYLERCVQRFFFARDIMDELLVFDERHDAREARQVLQDEALCAAGVSRMGRVFAYFRAGNLGEGRCGAFAVPITAGLVVAEDERLLEVIRRLGERDPLLVRGDAGFIGLITMADLQKPPVRMLLFAVVSIIELRWQGWIREHFGDGDGWHACLTPPRLDMARRLLEERNRNGWNLGLADCLQFSDRATIVLKTPELWERTLFTSRNQARDRIRAIQKLRDDLAHSQDLLVEDRQTILDLARWLGPVLEQLKGSPLPA